MKIKKILVNNFKCLSWLHEFNISWNLIYLVWENNTWKTTLLSAIDFLKSWGTEENSKTKNIWAEVETFVQIDFECNTEDISESKYHHYIFEENDCTILRMKRSSKDFKKIEIFDKQSNEFKNITWVDRMVGSLFETQFVRSDINPDDVSDFWSTKICGKLIKTITNDLEKTQHRTNLLYQHKELFHWEDSVFQSKKIELESQIEEIFNSQYWASKVRFEFNLPEPATFLKSWDIVIDDWIETKLWEKWSWMQRAMALTLIQVYAQYLATWKENSRSILFFIDEPEISLHPKAQSQLLSALKKISQKQQVFITTHSWFMLQQFNKTCEDLFVFAKKDNLIKINNHNDLNLFKRSPSRWEIMYKAFNLPTIEFHNELYWYIQENFQLKYTEEVEKYFISKWVSKIKRRQKFDSSKGIMIWNESDCTICQFIRHQIHHPENIKYNRFTLEELKNSIDIMIKNI